MLRELYPLLIFFLTGVLAVFIALYFVLDTSGREPSGAQRQFALPIDCTIGETCFIQNYVDVDPGPGVQDYACGAATYDGHKGTDFRVLSTAAADGVGVLSAAGGRVLRVRDSMADRLIRDYPSQEALKRSIGESDCGNGVVVDHGGGWTTQYCHLKRGSVGVVPGQEVAAGERLGTVGYSGMADFAHVHLSIRYEERVIDPFLGLAAVDAGCRRDRKAGDGLWQPALRDQLGYGRDTIIDAGFAGAPPDNDAMERDHRVEPPRSESPALVFYARMINLKAGDRIAVGVAGPDGFRAGSTTKPLERNRAVQLVYAGKKLKTERWPKGRYKGGVSVLRRSGEGEAAKVVAKKTLSFDLD